MTSELTLLAFAAQFNQYINQKHVLCDCIVELEYNNHLVLPLIETEMHNFFLKASSFLTIPV